MCNAPTSQSKHEDTKHKSPLDQTWFAFVALAVIAAIIIVLWLAVPFYFGKDYAPASDRGVLGDSFGSVNALFTGLAFAGLVFSILLQQRQIRLQRADFLRQIQEMKDSRITVEEQNQLLATQNQLIHGQTEVALLELQVRSMQLDAQVDELELQRMGAHLPQQSKEKLAGMRARVDVLNSKVGQLQLHLMKTQHTPVSTISTTS